jgi:hypothetical protein
MKLHVEAATCPVEVIDKYPYDKTTRRICPHCRKQIKKGEMVVKGVSFDPWGGRPDYHYWHDSCPEEASK